MLKPQSITRPYIDLQGSVIYHALPEEHIYGVFACACFGVHVPWVLKTDEIDPPHTVCLSVFTARETSPPDSH